MKRLARGEGGRRGGDDLVVWGGVCEESWEGKRTLYLKRRPVISCFHDAAEEDGDVSDVAFLEDGGCLHLG